MEIPSKDVSLYDTSSPSEFDKKFFGEQSLLSALSLDQLSTSKINDSAANGSDLKPPILTSLSTSVDPVSPSGFLMPDMKPQEPGKWHLTVPTLGKSSTPNVFTLKQKSAGLLGEASGELTHSQLSLDVSWIKSDGDGNRPYSHMESTALEASWSPKILPVQQPQPELSP